MSTERRYAVGRLDAATVVVVDDDGRSTALPRSRFRLALEEGMTLFVPFDGDGTPDWFASRADHAAADEIARDAQADPKGSKKGDAGGDGKD